MNGVRIGAVIAILLLMIYVVLSPMVAYGAVPRAILFLLSSASIAILLGAEVSTRFRLKGPGFIFVTTGTAALAFGLFLYLNSIIKPDLQVVIYDVYDEAGRAVNIEVESLVELRELPTNRSGLFFARRNQLVVVFPELVVQQVLRIRETTDTPFYAGKISYAGTRKASLKFGTDLTR